jgi:hypothetical protein
MKRFYLAHNRNRNAKPSTNSLQYKGMVSTCQIDDCLPYPVAYMVIHSLTIAVDSTTGLALPKKTSRQQRTERKGGV